jgi:AAT family amino acid transporter
MLPPEPLPVEMAIEKQLHRGLKPRHLQLIALGGIIGSGYFLGTGYVIQQTGPGAFLSYLLGGLIVLCVMYCLGELAVAIPQSGSFIKYANDLISPAWACGVGWSYWITWVSYVPSEMIAGGLIMEHFFPVLSAPQWALCFGLLITAINLLHVHVFGELEFWLALTKIVAILMFVFIAGLIAFGLIGTGTDVGSVAKVDFSFLFSQKTLFPFGALGVLMTMVIILVNFQGAEIIGLAAGESQDPSQSIPVAVRGVAWRILALYVIPVFLLVSIYPWDKLEAGKSVFSEALSAYGFGWAGLIFSIVVLTAAVSCSLSGLYGCTRVIHSLAKAGMAPAPLARLNRYNVPQNATLASTLACWFGIIIFVLDPDLKIYSILLSVSGFSGSIAWISICWSQYNFRKKLLAEKQNPLDLGFKAPFFPYLTLFAIWAQIACLIVLAFHAELRIAFYIGIPLLVIPILLYKFRNS